MPLTTRPIDLHDRLIQSPHLAGVAQTWGWPTAAGALSTPRIIWVPMSDGFGPASVESVPKIVNGERVFLTQIMERRAAVALHLLTEGEPVAAQRLLDDLIDRTVRALGSTTDLDVSIEMQAGRPAGPDECPPGATGYVLSLVLLVPIYEKGPAASTATVTTALR